MAKIIKNLSSEEKIYGGFTIPANSSHTILSNQLESFQKDDSLFNAFTSDPAEASIYSDSNPNELTGSEAVKFLLEQQVVVTDIAATYPFAQKKLPDGKKLKRRKHGKRVVCAGNVNTSIVFSVPYGHCKIDEVEIINCSGNDDVDLLVRDTAAGTYSQMFFGNAIPDVVLDQFGFDVACSDLYYSDSSNYDADLYLGMVIEIVFKNKEAESKNIGINFVLHEVI